LAIHLGSCIEHEGGCDDASVARDATAAAANPYREPWHETASLLMLKLMPKASRLHNLEEG
jgi:hypothetical protein